MISSVSQNFEFGLRGKYRSYDKRTHFIFGLDVIRNADLLLRTRSSFSNTCFKIQGKVIAL